ncbi:MAG: PQQ-like beta-propeller repeat protein, partial [Opitutales bacterium]|nr:PQQ-like beta-propeller repeat protein [Opitutales bacterium]
MKLLALPVFLLTTLTYASDWPHWLGPNGDGTSSESKWSNEINDPTWKSKVGVGFSAVSVANGKLYTMGHDGKKTGGKETVYCLNSQTGKSIWSQSYPAPLVDYLHEGGPCSTPTVDGSIVYTISKHGLLHAYQTKDGKVIWKKDMMKEAGMKRPPEWGFAASPYVLGDQLIIEASATYSLNKKTGKIIWKSKTYRPAYGTPTLFQPRGQSIIAILKTDGLVLLNSKNGKTLAFEKWETSYRTNASTPIVQGDKIFISTGYQRGCALFQWKEGKLKKLYENKVLSTHMNHAILVDGFLYGFDGNVHMAGKKDFVCMEFLTGKEQWRVS